MFTANPLLDPVLRGLILAAIAMLWVIFTVRLVGLRSFSKMTAFDFVSTVATGSLLAGAAQSSDWPTFFQMLFAIVGIFAVQVALAKSRRAWEPVEKVVQNQPILLMHDGEILEDALDRSRITRDDLIAKLREANVGDVSQVRAAVLETTGDVSILHGKQMDETLLRGVSVVS